MQRIIMHIDMNSYFASCEQQDNLPWRGRPLGVCEHLGGIIIAPSVEAKRWGVKTGMPVWEAKKLCPQIILTITNPDRYRYYTAKFLQVFEDYAEDIERYSIDEAFLDVTKVCNVRIKNYESLLRQGFGGQARIKEEQWSCADPFVEAERIAKEIKVRMKTEVGDYLRCSVGIGWSKLIAKIGSDMQKPDGLTILRPEDKSLLYKKLSLTDIPGIGTRQAKRLMGHGIRTLQDLRDCPRETLVRWFGILGHHLWSMGQLEGLWCENFTQATPLKSVGHMYTIAKEFRHVPKIGEQALYRLSEMVAKRLRGLGMGATALFAHVADKDHNFFGGTRQLGTPTSTGQEIFIAARHAVVRDLAGIWPALVNRVGVTAFGLRPMCVQQSLFPAVNKRHKLDVALDMVNKKYAKDEWLEARRHSKQVLERAALGSTPNHKDQAVLLPAPAFFAQRFIRDSIGFGRMKEFRVSSYNRGG